MGVRQSAHACVFCVCTCVSPDLGHAHISQVLAEMFSLSQGFKAKALLFLKIEAPERADAVSGGLWLSLPPPSFSECPSSIRSPL